MATAEYMRKWRAANPDRQRELYRNYRETNRDKYRKYKREYGARWREKNPERAKSSAARSREKHRDRLREEAKVRYYADPEKSRKYAREWQAARYNLVADIKLSSGCIDCGFNTHADALQFDHLPQYPKSFNIGPAIRSKNKQAVLDEINKCVVRCSNCHAIKTAERRKGR